MSDFEEEILISDSEGRPVGTALGRGSLHSLIVAFRVAVENVGDKSVMKLKEALDRRYDCKQKLRWVPDITTDPTVSTFIYPFRMDEVGRGAICVGLKGLGSNAGVKPEQGDGWVYLCLVLVPEGSRIPLFGNLKNRARRLSFRIGAGVNREFGIPEEVSAGSMPWLWKSDKHAYAITHDDIPRQSFIIYNRSHIEPF